MIKVTRFFGTSWCSDCKISKEFLAEHRIDYEYFDIDEDEEAAKIVEEVNNGKRKVPTIEFSDGTYLVEPSNAELAEKLDLISHPQKDLYEVIIVGSGPAGITCAIYTAREGMKTLVIEKGAPGGYVGYTHRVDNYPGFPEGIRGEKLAEKFVAQAQNFGVELLKSTLVEKVEKTNSEFTVTTSHGDIIRSKAVVIATGSEYRELGVEGEEELMGYRIHHCATCDGPFYKNKKLLVLGGGNTALEETLFLARFASEIIITEILDHLTASDVLQKEIEEHPNIETRTSYEIKRFIIGEKKSLEGVEFYDRANDKTVTLKPDGVFEFVGLKPNIPNIKELVELDKHGFILTDREMQTKTSGLFAVGDCRSGVVKQVAAAVGEGSIAAITVRDYLRNLSSNKQR